jgi:hypothetical protein
VPIGQAPLPLRMASMTVRAESTIGLFKTEALAKGSPFRTSPLRSLDDVEYATMEWVDWYNNRRLHSLLGSQVAAAGTAVLKAVCFGAPLRWS